MKRTTYRRGRHSVTALYTHLVFVTKYRTKVLTTEHIDYMREVCDGVATKMNFKLVQLNGESDHIHVQFEYPPKLSISQIVNSLKGVSSRMLRFFSICSLPLNMAEMLNVIPYAAAVSLLMISTGCSSWRTGLSRSTADWSNRSAEISCYSGGQLIYSGKTEGKVLSESNSDGYNFIAAEDGKLKEVSGDCIIKYD